MVLGSKPKLGVPASRNCRHAAIIRHICSYQADLADGLLSLGRGHGRSQTESCGQKVPGGPSGCCYTARVLGECCGMKLLNTWAYTTHGRRVCVCEREMGLNAIVNGEWPGCKQQASMTKSIVAGPKSTPVAMGEDQWEKTHNRMGREARKKWD